MLKCEFAVFKNVAVKRPPVIDGFGRHSESRSINFIKNYCYQKRCLLLIDISNKYELVKTNSLWTLCKIVMSNVATHQKKIRAGQPYISNSNFKETLRMTSVVCFSIYFYSFQGKKLLVYLYLVKQRYTHLVYSKMGQFLLDSLKPKRSTINLFCYFKQRSAFNVLVSCSKLPFTLYHQKR